MSRLLHLQENVATHLCITDQLPAGVGVPLPMEAAQTPLKKRENTGVRNAAETFSAISLTVLQVWVWVYLPLSLKRTDGG